MGVMAVEEGMIMGDTMAAAEEEVRITRISFGSVCLFGTERRAAMRVSSGFHFHT